MRRVVCNIATRGRPDLLRQTVRRTVRNITCPETVLLLSVDADDEFSCMAAEELTGKHVQVIQREREDSLGAKWNRMLDIPADLYVCQGDYTACVTPGWDAKLLEAASLFADGIGLVYGEMANASFPHWLAATRKWVDLVGYYPEYFSYWFSDHWLDDVGRMTGRIVHAPIQMQAYPRPDGGTQERRELHFWTAFFDEMQPERHAQANRVIDALDEPGWRKEVLRRNFYFTDYRSNWIHEHLRGVKLPEAAGDGGPRYARLREKALGMLREQRRAA